MFGDTITEKPGERSFVLGHVLERNLGATNDALVAALAAMGIEPDATRSSLVVGDGIKGDGNLTYYFQPVSNCGKYTAAELIKAWEDPVWHERNPHHPFAYVKCALLNFFAIQERNRKQTPLGKIRKGKKFALVSLDASPAFEGKILKRLERRR
jgi:hypothetical protein